MRLTPGTAAPHFTIADVHGATFELAKQRGRTTVLAFHRFAGCPLCNYAIRQLAQRAPELASRGIDIVNFFESSRENLGVALESWKPLEVRCIPDLELSVYSLYGVETSTWGAIKSFGRLGMLQKSISMGLPKGVRGDGDKTRQPAGFLIDSALTVRAVHYGTDSGDHVTAEMILDWLSALERETSAPVHAQVARV